MKVSVVIATSLLPCIISVSARRMLARPFTRPASSTLYNTAPNLRPFRKKRAAINDYGFCQARQETIAG